MNFKEIINANDNKDEIILGHNENDLLTVNIKENPSLIITGSTGTGKSILLDQVLLELINKNTSLEMGIISIDTSGVELNYYRNTNYALYSAINDIDKSVVAISRVLKEIERRKELLHEHNVLTVDEYNNIDDVSKLPLLVVAIDDDKLLLRQPDMDKMLSGIINNLLGMNIFFIMATSDVYNKFFTSDKNTLAYVLVSFDYADEEDSIKNNIPGSQNLGIGKFIARIGNKAYEYSNFDFDDKIIEEILE